MSRKGPTSFERQFLDTCAEFWANYFEAMQEVHTRQGRLPSQPIKQRNLRTTDSKHVSKFEQFWRFQLAAGMGVPAEEVGPRKVAFKPYRSKQFDVCWPLKGDPKILISIKSMQNAYRNLTNRIEEACGDSAVLRIYQSKAVFGFFFFLLDGNVPRGQAERGQRAKGDSSGRGRGVAPFLDLIEEGGDFFDLTDIDAYRKTPAPRPGRRQDVVVNAQRSLLDLVASRIQKEAAIYYDAIGFAPIKIRRAKPMPSGKKDWNLSLSAVDKGLDFRELIPRLLATAQVRGLL
jgi:hypothetical protein